MGIDEKNGKPELKIVAPPPGATFHHDDIVPPTPGKRVVIRAG